jgi:prepilin-type N-terminal cleavage/methylation domain-containing protein
MFEIFMQARTSNFRRASGFTLIEILVVIVVILLMIGMAMPVFRIINGSRSEQGAANNVSAMLARARADAIGLQKPVGVAFVYNPLTQLTSMAEVNFPPTTEFVTNTAYAAGQYVTVTYNGTPYYFVSTSATVIGQNPGHTQNNSGPWLAVYGPPLEMVTDTDLVRLPAGVAAQTICNTTYSNGQRQTDGYLSVGAILFDGKGRLASLPYGISVSSQLVTATGLQQGYPSVQKVIASTNGTALQFGVMSQFGLVLFQRDAFVGQNFSPYDPTYTVANSSGTTFNYTQQQQAYTNGSPSQQTEESWLDQNSTPLLIDRYTGELIKGE